MTFAAPGYLLAALGAALAVVALHFLAWRRPRPIALPTTRFVPEGASRAAARDLRLTDVALLATRVAALLFAGLALADPRFPTRRSGNAVVIVADRSRAVAPGVVRRAVDSIARDASTARVVWFDSRPAAATSAGVVTDSLATPRPVRGRLSPAIIAAVREATRLQRERDRVDIVVVSPFAREEWDAATTAIRATWGGALGTVRVPAARADSAPVTVGGAREARPLGDDDPVGAAMSRALGVARGVRAVRGEPSMGDTAFARAGGIVVAWPPAASPESATLTTISTGDVAVTGVMVRRAGVTNTSDAASGSDSSGGIAVAWDERGTVLARERQEGTGCIRSIDVAPPRRGDLAVSVAFGAIVRRLAAPCDAFGGSLVSDSALARWSEAPQVASPATADAAAHATRWLLLLALAMLALEWWLRRTRLRTPHEDAARAEGRDSAEVAA